MTNGGDRGGDDVDDCYCDDGDDYEYNGRGVAVAVGTVAFAAAAAAADEIDDFEAIRAPGHVDRVVGQDVE